MARRETTRPACFALCVVISETSPCHPCHGLTKDVSAPSGETHRLQACLGTLSSFACPFQCPKPCGIGEALRACESQCETCELSFWFAQRQHSVALSIMTIWGITKINSRKKCTYIQALGPFWVFTSSGCLFGVVNRLLVALDHIGSSVLNLCGSK